MRNKIKMWLILASATFIYQFSVVPAPENSASQAAAAAMLIPGGNTVGIRIDVGGVMVVSAADLPFAEGKKSPARLAGLRPGDVIKSVNNVATATVGQL